MEKYLSEPQLDLLVDVAVDLDEGPRERGAGLHRLDTSRAQLRAQLDRLNTAERLADGTVPLQRWLQKTIRRARQPNQAGVLRRLLDEVAFLTTGASPIPAPEQIHEFQEVIFHEDDMLPYDFLRLGLTAAAAVARLRVPRIEQGQPGGPSSGPRRYQGTGWLITSSLLLTNHHVINARNQREPFAAESDLQLQAQQTLASFDLNGAGEVGTDLAAVELVAADPERDYACLRLQSPLPTARRPLRVRPERLQVAQGQRIPVNIIQHPDGGPKMVACRNNLALKSTERDLLYFTDTRQGSSGSPVCDDYWRVVALHRSSQTIEKVNFQGRPTAYANRGTHLEIILEDLKKRAPSAWLDIQNEQS